MKKPPTMYRQGDVLVHAVDEIPESAKKAPRDPVRGVVLAEGEATGHAHRIPSRSAQLYHSEENARYLRAAAGGKAGRAAVQLGHEEHKTRCHLCPELPLVLATHYDAAAELPDTLERMRYSCETHAGSGDAKLEAPGKTVIPAGDYRVTIDADYVPGELPRNVAD